MKLNFLRYVTAGVASVVILMTGAGPADARPLKKEACDALVNERKELATRGAEKAIVNGPEWTRANMSAQTMGHVRRYLEVEEMLLFRCKGVSFADLAPQRASAVSAGKKKRTKTPTARPVKAPPLPLTKPVTERPKPAAKKAVAAVKIEMKPMPAKIDAAATKNTKTAALMMQVTSPPAAPPHGADANAPAIVVPLPVRKPTPAERTAYTKAIAEAAARAAALRKRRTKALRVTTPDIQQLLLSNDN